MKDLSIHCNSSCLYNRRGSTDVYVLYSRVHFYYLKIKDCVEEYGGVFFIDFIGVTLILEGFFVFVWSWRRNAGTIQGEK